MFVFVGRKVIIKVNFSCYISSTFCCVGTIEVKPSTNAEEKHLLPPSSPIATMQGLYLSVYQL